MKFRGRDRRSAGSSVTAQDHRRPTTRLGRATGSILKSAARVAAHAAGTMRATQAGAAGTTAALQTLPDSTLRGFAATSVGVGAGLYLAGKRRVVVAAGLVPALLAGAAIVLRRVEPAARVDAVE